MSYDVFAEVWLQGIKAWSRPLDIPQMPDGALLVSDDRAGAIYRISYEAANDWGSNRGTHSIPC